MTPIFSPNGARSKIDMNVYTVSAVLTGGVAEVKELTPEEYREIKKSICPKNIHVGEQWGPEIKYVGHYEDSVVFKSKSNDGLFCFHPNDVTIDGELFSKYILRKTSRRQYSD